MRQDQEDEFYEKEIDELPGGFHVVNEDEAEDEDIEVPLEKDLIEEDLGDDDIVEANDFKGKDFDFENEEESE